MASEEQKSIIEPSEKYRITDEKLSKEIKKKLRIDNLNKLFEMSKRICIKP